MVEAGGGIYLTRDWDFEIGETGAIRTVTGIDELEKDLAFSSAIALDDVLGEPLTPSTKTTIRSTIQGIMNTDPRISQVRSLQVSYPNQEEVQIRVEAQTTDADQPLVFEI